MCDVVELLPVVPGGKTLYETMDPSMSLECGVSDNTGHFATTERNCTQLFSIVSCAHVELV